MEIFAKLEPVLSALTLVALLLILLVLVRSRRKDTGAGLGRDGAPFSPDGQFVVPGESIYAIADQLGGLYTTVAHPKEMERDSRFQAGVDLLCGADHSPEVLADFALGDHAIVSCMAFEAMRVREDTAEAWREVVNGIASMVPWAQYFALRYLAETAPAEEPMIGRVLGLMTVCMENRLCCATLEKFIWTRCERGEPLEFGPEDTWFLNVMGMTVLKVFLDQIDPMLGRPLRASLGEAELEGGAQFDMPPDGQSPMQPEQVDILKSAGRIWGQQDSDRANELVMHPELEIMADELEKMVTASQPQSVLLTGESGVGKTALKSVLATRLKNAGWTIFIAGHNDLLAGQVFIGQLEGRLQRIVARLSGGKKTVWIIPDIDRLAFTGTHQHSDFSALDAILPHVADGNLRIVANCETGALDRLVHKQPRIASTMTTLKVPALPATVTLEIARRWITKRGLEVEEGTLHEVWDLAEQYLIDRSAPGNVMDLIKATCLRLATNPATEPLTLTADDVIVTLARQTGLPLDLLDAKQELDLDGLERTLSERVIGQDEAVKCLVDRVAMMKAGLADPTRPYGVFLFAGPTGTGKTEIAKALATWLFGSPERLIRLDMSELQTPESLDRLLGTTGKPETESLADQVRKQPFSVVLLDEFEKAHPNVWDLFLQIFDDARITDRAGRTTSFKHTIIILTANLGATIPTGTSIGFGSRGSRFDVEDVRNAVAHVFRREFINRLDRVIVFRPLDRELMREILYRELKEVFDRRGLKGRPWAVEWDESAIAFLLEKGFTRDLGARPLKRAVERYLLSPLAAAIVRHQAPEGDQFLFLSCRGDDLHVEFVDPDRDEVEPSDVAAEAPVPVEAAAGGIDRARAILLQPSGTPEELASLKGLLNGIRDQVRSDEWRLRKDEHYASMEGEAFWSSPGRFAALGQLEAIDRIEKGEERARGMLARLEARRGTQSLPRRLLALLAQNAYLLATACEDVAGERPCEAFLMIEADREGLRDGAASVAFGGQIADMYETWARKRNMRLTRLARSAPDSALGIRALYAVSGYGAYSILAPECGLHVRERPGESGRGPQRETIRVTLAAQPDGPLPSPVAKAIEVAEQAIGAAKPQAEEIVRRYREAPSPLVRDLVRGWRTGRIDLVLGGDFDLFQG